MILAAFAFCLAVVAFGVLLYLKEPSSYSPATRRVLRIFREKILSEDDKWKREGIEELREIGKASVHVLMKEARDPESRVRRRAVWALGYLRDREALPAIHSAMGDPSPEVRAVAILSLTRLDRKGAAPYLITALKDPDGDVRLNASFSLRECGGRNAEEALCRALGDRSRFVRNTAAASLLLFHNASGFRYVLDQLQSPDRHQRSWANKKLVQYSGVDMEFFPMGGKEGRETAAARWKKWLYENVESFRKGQEGVAPSVRKKAYSSMKERRKEKNPHVSPRR